MTLLLRIFLAMIGIAFLIGGIFTIGTIVSPVLFLCFLGCLAIVMLDERLPRGG